MNAFGSLLLCQAAILTFAVGASEEAKESGSGATAGPAAVGKEAIELLSRTMTMRTNNYPLGMALEMCLRLSEDPIKVKVSQQAGEKLLTFELLDASWAEALRHITKLTSATFRVADGTLLIAMPDEFAAIDAGKAKFIPYEAEKNSAEKKNEK